MSDLLDVAEARERMLAAFSPVKTETVTLQHAWKRILAQDVIANTDWPPFATSTMDGFAVRCADVVKASENTPVTLKVVADLPAGVVSEITLGPGEAARIMTGAPIPQGVDAVVPVEKTDIQPALVEAKLPDSVQIFQAAEAGAFIRPVGQDLRQGETVLTHGNMLHPQDVGLLAMLGISPVIVHRKPRVALISTGNELLPPDQPLLPGKIHDSNTFSLAALIAESGGEVISLGIAPDEFQAIQQLLDEAVAEGADLIISSAGVSVGTYDYVRAVIETHGHLEFWRVNMRPGKPVAFGEYRGVQVIGLPGNPVSAYIGFQVFARPVVSKLSGRKQIHQETIPAILEFPIESDGRESYLRAIVTYRDGFRWVRLTGHQGSGNLYSLVQANALLIVPSGVKSLPARSEVGVWSFER